MRFVGFGFQVKVVVCSVPEETVELVESTFEWMEFGIKMPFSKNACLIPRIFEKVRESYFIRRQPDT